MDRLGPVGTGVTCGGGMREDTDLCCLALADDDVTNAASRASLLVVPPACFVRGKLAVGDQTKAMNVTDSQRRLNGMMAVENANADAVPVCKLLLVLHAPTGCDTTSRFYGIGKVHGWHVASTEHGLQSNAAATLF